VTVEGTASGTTDISVDSTAEIRNGTNVKYTLGSFEAATVSVSQSITMPGRQQPARDIDGDGLLEDLDGDGQANVFDAIELANNANAPVVQNNLQLFDHDGDGKVDVFDAVELANEVRN
jgi:PKD repeat protein